MILRKFEKNPADVKDYDIDYSPWLVESDTIQSVTVVSDTYSIQSVTPIPDIIPLEIKSVFNTPNRIKIWIAGGIDGVSYKVSATITTEDGRVLQHEFIMKVRDR